MNMDEARARAAKLIGREYQLWLLEQVKPYVEAGYNLDEAIRLVDEASPRDKVEAILRQGAARLMRELMAPDAPTTTLQ